MDCFTTEESKHIDWISYHCAVKTLSPQARQYFLSKWSAGMIGMGKNMLKWNLRFLGHCPYCLETGEDNT